MIVESVVLGLVVNPYSAAVGAAIAAVIWTRAKSGRGIFWGWVVLAAAWLLGEGVFRLEYAREFADAGATALWPGLAIEAAVSMLVGYALPAWAGAFVGRRVTWGTGWLAAAFVALTAAGAAYALGAAMASRF